jgi:alpha-ketoglutarate-dependent taurine dioxygenase
MFEITARKVVESNQNNLKFSFICEKNKLPLVIECLNNDIILKDWIAENITELNSRLLQYGAILFRGFSIDNVDKLKDISLCFFPELLPYKEKRTPRTSLADGVYSSTIHQADQYIHFHNDMSYSHQWPMKILFACFKPAANWGFTPIADSRKVLQLLSNETRRKFEKHGVLYLKNFYNNIGLSWQNTFDTHNREDIEVVCKKHNISFEWLESDRLRTKQIRHAIAQHPLTNEWVWFNQSHHFHILSLDSDVVKALTDTYKEDDFPRHAYFGNGEIISKAIIDEITQCYKEVEVGFEWRQGDVMVVDNMLTAHSRTPYSGDRLIAVTLGEMYTPIYEGGGKALANKINS